MEQQQDRVDGARSEWRRWRTKRRTGDNRGEVGRATARRRGHGRLARVARMASFVSDEWCRRVGVLVLEVVAFAVASVISLALWHAPATSATSAQRCASRRADVALPETLAVVLDLVATSVARSAPTTPVRWRGRVRASVRCARPRSSAPTDHRSDRSPGRWSPSRACGECCAWSWSSSCCSRARHRSRFRRSRCWRSSVASQLALTVGHFLLSDGLDPAGCPSAMVDGIGRRRAR